MHCCCICLINEKLGCAVAHLKDLFMNYKRRFFLDNGAIRIFLPPI